MLGLLATGKNNVKERSSGITTIAGWQQIILGGESMD